jgi:hypothetical protein
MKTIKTYIFLFIALLCFSCEKDPIAPIGKGNINSISTNDPVNITPNSAVVGLNIVNQGGEAIGNSGLNFALGNSSPTANDNSAIGSTAFGSTSLTLRDLIPGRTYFVKSFATTRSGKMYFGNLKSFTTSNHASNLTNGTLAYFPLNGDGVDYNNTNNSLSFLNFLQPVASRNGTLKSAYFFNGSNSTMYKGAPNGFPRGRNPYSLTFWFKPTVTTSGTIIGFGTGGGVNLGSVYFKLNNFGGCTIYHWNFDVNFPYSFNPNLWYFAAITFDGTNEILWLKEFGTSRDWVGWQFQATAININPLHFSVGSRVVNSSGAAVEYFNGSIDDVRVFNRALNSTEIGYWYSN